MLADIQSRLWHVYALPGGPRQRKRKSVPHATCGFSRSTQVFCVGAPTRFQRCTRHGSFSPQKRATRKERYERPIIDSQLKMPAGMGSPVNANPAAH